MVGQKLNGFLSGQTEQSRQEIPAEHPSLKMHGESVQDPLKSADLSVEPCCTPLDARERRPSARPTSRQKRKNLESDGPLGKPPSSVENSAHTFQTVLLSLWPC